MTKEKNKGGRPTKYDKDFHCKDIIRQAKEGASIEEVAFEWEISKKTIYNWTEEHEEFLHSFNIARELSTAWWMNYGRKNMENKDLNARMYEIQVMNRIGWSKKNDTDLTSQGEKLEGLKVTFV